MSGPLRPCHACRKPAVDGACTTHPRPSKRSRYDNLHRRLRREIDELIRSGAVVRCARCGGLIRPGESWHLDHADNGAGYLGPSHALCNLRAGAAKANQG